jgi:type I restriction enzyme R subunit
LFELKKQKKIFEVEDFEDKQKVFSDFVLDKYVKTGIEELHQEKLPKLIKLKYKTIEDGIVELGNVEQINETFISFQKYLY